MRTPKLIISSLNTCTVMIDEGQMVKVATQYNIVCTYKSGID